MNRLIVFLLLAGSVICPLANVKALSNFAPELVTELAWGSGNGQVALNKAPANNFGPPRLLIDESGVFLYLLDSSNQRIVIFNSETSQFSTVSMSSNEPADDFCVLDNGKHFYLLFNQTNQVILYNRLGNILRLYSIDNQFKPLSFQCDQKRGMIFQATDGHFYRFGSDTSLTLIPQHQYGFFLDKQSDSKGTLWLHHYDDNLSQEIAIDRRTGPIETLSFVGVDGNNNVYLTVEETDTGAESDNIRRFLRKYNNNGQLEAETEIPSGLFAYTLQDLVVTKSGEVLQMVPLQEHLKIVKWIIVTAKSRHFDPLSAQLFSQPQADDFLPSEADGETPMRGILPPTARHTMMEKAKAFANQSFYVNWANIARGEYLGRKRVITPIYRPGRYQGIPYKWGGFDSIRSFQNGLRNGKKAGDKNIVRGFGGSHAAVGVDCSGLVSQVWGLQQKQNTSYLQAVSILLGSFNQLRPGDILNRVGRHVRLFSHRDVRGKFWVYEASSKDWKVSTRPYSSSSLRHQRYKPYRYKNVLESGSSIIPQYDPRKKPTRFYIYGNRAIREGQSAAYRAKVFYSDDTYQDVTDRSHWSENSRYTHFNSARLDTERVRRNRYAYIKASYRENGHSFAAGINVTIRNTRWRGLGDIGKSPESVNRPIHVDIQYRYRPNKGLGEVSALTEGQVLYSGDTYQITFTPAQKAYIYIFQTDSSQNVYRLFPTDSLDAASANYFNPVLPNNTYSIPAQQKWFFLDNQMGEETIYFIATQEPQPNLEQYFQQIENARSGNNLDEMDLAQTQLFEEDIKHRGLARIPTPSSANDSSSLWQDDESQPFSMKQQLKTCEGCVNILHFEHR